MSNPHPTPDAPRRPRYSRGPAVPDFAAGQQITLIIVDDPTTDVFGPSPLREAWAAWRVQERMRRVLEVATEDAAPSP